MNSSPKLLDVVALTVDLPQYNLWRRAGWYRLLKPCLVEQPLKSSLAIEKGVLMNLLGAASRTNYGAAL